MVALLAVAQFAPGASAEHNLATIDRLVARAADRGASLVVLPEYASWFDREPGAHWLPHAQPLDGAFVAGLTRIAAAHGATIVAGMLETAGDERRVRNTAVAVASDGLLARYRKLHLYDAFGAAESAWIEPGAVEAPETFEWEGLRVGLQTCYDLRFPEATRRIVDAGADVVAVPSEWVRGPLKEHHWETLVTARAIENTVYVAASDHTPPIGVGASLVADPMGVALARLGEREDVAVAAVDAERLAEVRRTNPALRLRRFDVVARTGSR